MKIGWEGVIRGGVVRGGYDVSTKLVALGLIDEEGVLEAVYLVIGLCKRICYIDRVCYQGHVRTVWLCQYRQ